MYAGRAAYCLLVSHGEYADGTDGRTPDRYITLFAGRGQRYNYNAASDRTVNRTLHRHWIFSYKLSNCILVLSAKAFCVSSAGTRPLITVKWRNC